MTARYYFAIINLISKLIRGTKLFDVPKPAQMPTNLRELLLLTLIVTSDQDGG